ncbi:MAG: beta-lactamase family protein [Nevskiales bacterium]|nr:beta-lactamase family protein [Nevskiales bacterium]
MSSIQKMTRRQALLGVGATLGLAASPWQRLGAAEAAGPKAAVPFALTVDRKAAAAHDFTALRQLLQGAVDREKVPCASMLLMHQDRVLFKEAFGWADIENKKPMQTDTICHLASATKWITAAGLMTAVEEGLISLDDPVGKYLPGLRDIPVKGSNQKGNPTIRQCWSQTHAFPPGLEFKVLNKPNMSLFDSVSAYANGAPQLVALPGTQYAYSNEGMTVTGAIIEKVTGKPYRAFLQKRILDPLEMKDTSFYPQGEQRRRVAKRYAPKKLGGGFELMPSNALNEGADGITIVGGGLRSTLDDYAKFLSMIVHGGQFGARRVLSEASVREICKDQAGNVPVKKSPYRDQKGYGLGVALMERDEKGESILVIDGGMFGVCSWIDFGRGLIGLFFTQTRMGIKAVYDLATLESVAAARAALDSART